METSTVNTGNEKYDLKSAFFDMAYSPFVILNKDLVFIDVNEAAISSLKLKRENFVGKSLLELFPYLKGTDRYNSYKKVIETGNPIGFDEVSFHNDKGVFKFIVRAFKIGDGLGITTLDVSDLMKTIDKLKTTQDNLEKVNENLKLNNQELEELSYVTAHDLRAPLTNLHSLMDMFETENTMTDNGLIIFDKIKISTQLMCDKIRALNNVIALKSNAESKKEEVDFSEILKKIRESYSQAIINTRTIIKEDFSSCPTITYNPKQLETTLQNLVCNAIKYKHPKRKPVITLKTKIVKGVKTLIIKDNGLGFDSTIDKNKIFGLFKRMHTHVEGLGVGLYVVNSILKNNNGSINVKSEINKGSEFKVLFNDIKV